MTIAEWFDLIWNKLASAATLIAVPLVTWMVARSSRRTVKEQEAVEHWKGRAVAAERGRRILDDYANDLRRQLKDAGQDPVDWPEGLNE